MNSRIKRATVAAAMIVAASGVSVAVAEPASAATNWNIPFSDIHYPSYPECNVTGTTEAGYATETCEGQYTIAPDNYIFTQDNLGRCPVDGNTQKITLDYVENPASGGVTTTKTLAGFSMGWTD